MTQKLGFDLPSGFAYRAVSDVVMNRENFERARDMLVGSNRMIAIGEETVRRAAANALVEGQKFYGLGAQLYAITFGYAEPEKANSKTFNTHPGFEVAKEAGMELLNAELKGGFYKVAEASLDAMRHHSPALNDFLQRLADTLTSEERKPLDSARAMMHGAALMRYVHIRGKNGLVREHLSE